MKSFFTPSRTTTNNQCTNQMKSSPILHHDDEHNSLVTNTTYTRIGIAIVLLILLSLMSCKEQPTEAVVYYKVKLLHGIIPRLVSSIEPSIINEYVYQKGDTVWVDASNDRIDNSGTDMAIVIKRMNNIVLDDKGNIVLDNDTTKH